MKETYTRDNANILSLYEKIKILEVNFEWQRKTELSSKLSRLYLLCSCLKQQQNYMSIGIK